MFFGVQLFINFLNGEGMLRVMSDDDSGTSMVTHDNSELHTSPRSGNNW